MSATLLSHQFLIAMPSLADPNFFHSVTFVCEHSKDGALGIVINHPLTLHLGEVMAHMNITVHDASVNDQPVYLGGPVQPERGFVIHRPQGEWNSMLRLPGDMAITTSRDILEAMARGEGPAEALVALGYAGWGAGQLEKELAENAWLYGPADPNILFQTPSERRWNAAAACAGIDLSRLSGEVGHA